VAPAGGPLRGGATPRGRSGGGGAPPPRPAGRSPEAAAPRSDPLAGGPGVGH